MSRLVPQCQYIKFLINVFFKYFLDKVAKKQCIKIPENEQMLAIKGIAVIILITTQIEYLKFSKKEDIFLHKR